MRWSWPHHPLTPTGREGRADPGTGGARVIRRLLRHAGGVTTVAEFLRARREQLQPGDVGLPDSGRRRTPGLRREEVATLAGVSIDYLVRLEQGRDTEAVAERDRRARRRAAPRRRTTPAALHAGHDQPERGAVPSAPPAGPRGGADRDGAPRATRPDAGVRRRPGQRRARLERRVGAARPPARNARRCDVPNLARHVFLHPDARTVYPDWVAAADEQVSRLRAATARWGDDDDFAALMDELRTAPDFIERWSTLRDDREAPRYDAPRAPRPRPTAPQLRGAPPPR